MRENEITARTDFPPRGKAKKCWKSFVARERNAENAKNSVSLASDERKTRKIVLRGIPKGRNSEKQCFGMPRRVVFGENEPSGSPEASKFQEISFRGVPKPQNFKKQAFGESRSSKNLKNGTSGCPEKAKCDISKRKVLAEDWKRRVLIEYDRLAYYKNTASTVELSGVSYILR